MAETPTQPLPRVFRSAVMKFIASILSAVPILATFNSARADVIIRNDMGGNVGEYMQIVAAARDHGERVIIDGDCFSACTLYAAMIPRNRICVTPRAALGFHQAHSSNWYGGTESSVAGTDVLFAIYPARIRNWIRRHGGLGTEMLILRGPELNAMYPACK